MCTVLTLSYISRHHAHCAVQMNLQFMWMAFSSIQLSNSSIAFSCPLDNWTVECCCLNYFLPYLCFFFFLVQLTLFVIGSYLIFCTLFLNFHLQVVSISCIILLLHWLFMLVPIRVFDFCYHLYYFYHLLSTAVSCTLYHPFFLGHLGSSISMHLCKIMHFCFAMHVLLIQICCFVCEIATLSRATS